MDAYAKQANVWDWDGYDNSDEHEYWRRYAEQFGNMAQRGFHVLAFDMTEEMIREGKKRFGSVAGLALEVADICDFSFRKPRLTSRLSPIRI